MKTIIKVCLAAIALFIGMNLHAQSPISYGIKAGVNLANFDIDGTDVVDDSDAKLGFNVGVTLDYAFTPEWYLLTGLEYTIKGAKFFDGNLKANLGYLQLPIHAGYKLEVADNMKIVFHAGPYFAYGINGKYKDSDSEIGTDAFKKYLLEGGVGMYETLHKRFDFGAGAGVGAEFGKIGVGIGYDFGLVNTGGGAYDRRDEKVRNMNAYLTVGYKF